MDQKYKFESTLESIYNNNQIIFDNIPDLIMNDHMAGVDMPIIKILDKIERNIPIPPRMYESEINFLYTNLGEYDIAQFDVEINPISVVKIDPSKIVENTGRIWKPWANRRQLVGRVMDGDWYASNPKFVPDYAKPYPKKFSEMVVYESFREHFINDEPWENTSLYDRWMSAACSNDDATYIDSSDVENRLQYMDELFKDIKMNGYKSQLEIANRRASYLQAILNEITIDIGPSGQPLFVDGRHRLSMAKLLDIDKIPVFVLVRHRHWVTTLEH